MYIKIGVLALCAKYFSYKAVKSDKSISCSACLMRRTGSRTVHTAFFFYKSDDETSTYFIHKALITIKRFLCY